MRVVIAGAGSVGRSIARELLGNGHQVLLIDKDADDVQASRVPEASWLLADACELAALEEARLEESDVCVAATGDDKANLVLSLLAKTEFGVPRTSPGSTTRRTSGCSTSRGASTSRVSTPRLMTALIEEAVSIGDLVRIFEFQQGRASMVEITLPEGSPFAGRRVGDVDWPTDTVLVAIIREERPLAPTPDDAIEAGDELLFITTTEQEDRLQDLVAPGERHHADSES